MRGLGYAGAVTMALASVALMGAGPPPPPQISVNPKQAPAGRYVLDPSHSTVAVRVLHRGGISWSNFRFGDTSGELDWTPDHPERSKATVTVRPGSITTPVKGFAEELASPPFLNAAAFPTATFTTKSITLTGPRKAKIRGDLTLMGVTAPLDVDAEFIGTGINTEGRRGLGFSGQAKLERSVFPLGSIPHELDHMQLVIDLEFDAPK